MTQYHLEAVGAMAEAPEQSVTDTLCTGTASMMRSWGQKSNWRQGWFRACANVFNKDKQRGSTARRTKKPTPLAIHDDTTYQKVASILHQVRAVYVVHMEGV